MTSRTTVYGGSSGSNNGHGGDNSSSSNNANNNSSAPNRYRNGYNNNGYGNHGAVFARCHSTSSSIASSLPETLSDDTQESCDANGSFSSSCSSAVAPFAMAPPSGRDDSIPLSRSEEGGSDVSLMASASDDRDRCDLSASSASSSPRPRRADGDSSSGGGKAGASAHQNLEALLPGMGGVSPKRRAPHKKEGVGACGNASGNAARKPPRGGGGADGGRCPFGLVGSIARTIVEEEEEDLAESEGAEGLSREEGRESGESCEDGGTRGNGGNGGPRDSSSSSIMVASTDAHSSVLLGGASAGASAGPAAAAAATAASAAAATVSADPVSPVALRTHSCRVALAATSPRNVSGRITGGLPAVAAASASASHSKADTEEWAGAASPGCLCEVHPALWKVQTFPRSHGHGDVNAHGHGVQMQLHTRQQTAQPGLQQDVKQQQQQQQQEAQTVQAAQQDGEEWSISPPGSPQAATLSGVSAYFCGLPAGCILKRNSQPQQQRQRQQQRQACASCKKRVAESNPPRCLRCRQAVYCSSKCLSRHLNAHSRSCPGMRASRAAGSKRLGPGLGRVIVVDDDGNECAYKENNRIPVQPACSVSSAAESHLSWNCGYQNDGTSVEYSRCASATNAAATPAPATSYNATKKTAAAAAGRTGVTSPRSGMHSRITPHPSHPSTRTVTPSFAPVPSAAAASASTLSASTSGTASAATGVPGLCMGAA